MSEINPFNASSPYVIHDYASAATHSTTTASPVASLETEAAVEKKTTSWFQNLFKNSNSAEQTQNQGQSSTLTLPPIPELEAPNNLYNQDFESLLQSRIPLLQGKENAEFDMTLEQLFIFIIKGLMEGEDLKAHTQEKVFTRFQTIRKSQLQTIEKLQIMIESDQTTAKYFGYAQTTAAVAFLTSTLITALGSLLSIPIPNLLSTTTTIISGTLQGVGVAGQSYFNHRQKNNKASLETLDKSEEDLSEVVQDVRKELNECAEAYKNLQLQLIRFAKNIMN